MVFMQFGSGLENRKILFKSLMRIFVSNSRNHFSMCIVTRSLFRIHQFTERNLILLELKTLLSPFTVENAESWND